MQTVMRSQPDRLTRRANKTLTTISPESTSVGTATACTWSKMLIQPEEHRELLIRALIVIAVSKSHGRLAIKGRRFRQRIAAD